VFCEELSDKADPGREWYFLYDITAIMALEDETGLASDAFGTGTTTLDGVQRSKAELLTTRQMLAWLRWGLSDCDPTLDDARLGKMVHSKNAMAVNLAAYSAWGLAIPPKIARAMEERAAARVAADAAAAEAAAADPLGSTRTSDFGPPPDESASEPKSSGTPPLVSLVD
jgi:hypothetical protein